MTFAGSLRKGSIHKALIRAAQGLAPDGMTISEFDLAPIPLYNMDLEAEMPPSVADFKDRIEAADGVLLSCPEHNFSFSGVLKNAIDWASRPSGQNSFAGKPVAIMSASPGMMGGSRAQYHLRQVLFYLQTKQMGFPEMFVASFGSKSNDDGELSDEATRNHMQKFLASFLDFIKSGR